MHLEVRNLSRVYQGGQGLHATSFQVNHGELIAIVGHNGAGKSTLLKLLGGWLVPDSGEARIDEVDLRNRHALVCKIGFIPEMPNLFDMFSVQYNLALFVRLFGISLSRIDETLQEFNLLAYRHNKVRTLSKGLQQRVSIGRSLLANPPLLLLDEPTSGLDFEMTKEVYELLRKNHASGKTILFTSHRPEEIKALATRIMVLHRGALIFDGPPTDYFESQIHQTLYS